MIQRSLKACVISSCTGNILLNHPLGSIALNLPKLAMLLASLFQFSKASPTSTLDIDQYHIVLVSNSLVSVQMILTSHDDHMIARLLAAQVLYRFQYEFQSILPEILVKLETEANKQSQDYTLSQALQGNSASSSTLLEFQVFQVRDRTRHDHGVEFISFSSRMSLQSCSKHNRFLSLDPSIFPSHFIRRSLSAAHVSFVALMFKRFTRMLLAIQMALQSRNLCGHWFKNTES